MIVVNTGVPEFTIKALGNATTSAPVATVTLRAPVAAAGSMFRTAVAEVGELLVRLLTVTPAPKSALVVP